MDKQWTIAYLEEVKQKCIQKINHNKFLWDVLEQNQQFYNSWNNAIRERYPELIDIDTNVVKTIVNEWEIEVKEEGMRIHQDKNPLPPIEWNTKKERFENLVTYYARGFDYNVFVKARQQYGVPEEILACIAYAETHIWNANKSTANIMNYGNNDRWETRDFNSVQGNVNAVAHWLTQGKYLSHNTILGELSQWGRAILWLPWCAEQWEYCYATSPENWRGNVYDCLTMIHWEKKDWDRYPFKK